MAGRIVFFFVGLLVLCNYCYAGIEVLLGIKIPSKGNERKKFCDYPECVCYYIHDNCPVDLSIECSEDYYCNTATNKPCCAGQKPCHSNPCKNGGTCTVVGTSSFECTCAEGFQGPTCEEIKPCHSNPCKNGGTCTDVGTSSFECTCAEGFQGPTCEEQKPCHSNPCKNGGTCTDVGTASFECTCAEGFQGPTCEEPICSNPEIDMVYVIDGSGSIGDENFNKIKDFIQKLNKRFVIGNNDVRVGIQEYSFSSKFIYPVHLGEADKNGNIDLLNDVVANMPYLEGGSYTGDALKRARTVMLTDAKGDRINIPDILILYTDGQSPSVGQMVNEAAKLKQNGVKIICVGIGPYLYLESLIETASPSCKGTGDKLVFQADFNELDTITDAIAQEACNCA